MKTSAEPLRAADAIQDDDETLPTPGHSSSAKDATAFEFREAVKHTALQRSGGPAELFTLELALTLD